MDPRPYLMLVTLGESVRLVCFLSSIHSRACTCLPSSPLPPLKLCADHHSGVDATVADKSAYLSHVFGLRAVPSNSSGSVGSRSVSIGTVSTRSTSGSSNASYALGNHKGDVSRVSTTSHTSYVTAGGTVHSRPLVVRDPNQIIGLRQTPGVETSEEGIKLETRVAQKIADTEAANGRSGLLPLAYHRVPKSTVLRSQLGAVSSRHGPSPNSPSRDPAPDVFRHLTDAAVRTQPDESRIIAAMAEARALGMTMLPFRNWEKADAHIREQQMTAHAVTKSSPPADGAKADASSDWRRKTSGSGPSVDAALKNVAEAIHANANSPPAKRTTIAGDKVLTVDGLFEKFGLTGEVGSFSRL
jgi:hypothetical protein